MLAGRFVACFVGFGADRRPPDVATHPERVSPTGSRPLELFAVVAFLAWSVAVGRVVLALLPPGSVGGHGLRELPMTIAVSLFLGLATFAVGWNALPHRTDELFEFPTSRVVAIGVVAAILGVVRVAFGPAAMVPRHEPSVERSSAWIGWICAASVLAGFVGGVLAPVSARSPWFVGFGPVRTDVSSSLARAPHAAIVGAQLAAVVVLVGAALATLRRTHATRAVVSLLAVSSIAMASHATELLACAVGSLGAVAWLRRGDFRGLALVALAFHALVWIDPKAWPISIAALACLAAASPLVSWKRVGLAIGVGLIPLCWRPWALAHAPDVRTPSALQIGGALAIVAVFAFALSSRIAPERRERLGPECLWLGLSLVAALVAMARWGSIAPYADGQLAYPTLVDALVPCFVFLLVLLGGISGAKQRDATPR